MIDVKATCAFYYAQKSKNFLIDFLHSEALSIFWLPPPPLYFSLFLSFLVFLSIAGV